MNPASRQYWLTLAVLDLLLIGMGFIFVARAALRRLVTSIRPGRRYEN
jgi:hypothetical protein